MSYAISNLTNFLIRSTYWTLSLEHEGNKLTLSCALFIPNNMGCMFQVTNRNKWLKQIGMHCATPKSSISKCLNASSSRTFPLIFFHESKWKYDTIPVFTESQSYTKFKKKHENYSELPTVIFTMTDLSNSDPSILLSLKWSSILLVMKIHGSVLFSS